MKQKLKQKFITVLPYWLIALVLMCSAVNFPYNVFGKTVDDSFDQPAVLGAFTDKPEMLRGQEPISESQITQLQTPDTSAVNAKSFLVFDLTSGQELLSQNADQKLAIASLTKLMTGLVSYEQLNLNQDFLITSADKLDVNPNLGLVSGDKIKGLDLFNAMIIGSNNDAALTLAHLVNRSTGQDFVSLMNDKAKALGMTNTSYSNPIGFDALENFSTAQDLKKIIIETQKLSVFTDIGRRVRYDFITGLNYKYHTNATNKLLTKYPDIFAIKTGFTNNAQGAMAVKLILNKHQIVILVLDSKDREGDTLKLKEIVEQDFQF